jgi:hypothetical protein
VRDLNGVVVNVVGHATDSPAAVVPLPDPHTELPAGPVAGRVQQDRAAPSMTAMDITNHSTFKRLRLVRRTEVLRNG